jgi:hypothetical protein
LYWRDKKLRAQQRLRHRHIIRENCGFRGSRMVFLRLSQSISEFPDKVTPNRKAGTVMSPRATVRQILERPGEIWGAESGTDKLVVIRTK